VDGPRTEALRAMVEPALTAKAIGASSHADQYCRF
jgi:hypothetical protein